MDWTATRSDGCSLRCSSSSRTARSRTSGENLFALFLQMAPFSQEWEPLQSPGRFTAPHELIYITDTRLVNLLRESIPDFSERPDSALETKRYSIATNRVTQGLGLLWWTSSP